MLACSSRCAICGLHVTIVARHTDFNATLSEKLCQKHYEYFRMSRYYDLYNATKLKERRGNGLFGMPEDTELSIKVFNMWASELAVDIKE